MRQLIQTFWGLCRLQNGPQDIPYSQQSMMILLAITVGLSMLSAMRIQNAMNALWLTFLSIAVTLGAIYVGLRLRKFQARFVQTSTAYLGANIIIALVTAILMMAVLFLASFVGQQGIQLAAGAILIGGLIWTIVVCAHIFRQALGVPWFAAVLFTLMLELLKAIVIRAAMMGGS